MGSTIKDQNNYMSMEESIAKLSEDKNRFVPMEERRDTGVLSAELLTSIAHGNIIVKS